MEAARYFLKLPTDPELYVLSEWMPISLTPEPAAQLCNLHIYVPQSRMLFTTQAPVPASECNAQIQGNVYQTVREVFCVHRDKFDYSFAVVDMDSSAQLEVRLAINSSRTSFLRLVTVKLERVFLDDTLGCFMGNVEKMAMFMTVISTQEEVAARDRRIAGFARLETFLTSAKEDAQRIREETGVTLASRVLPTQLLVLYNSLKQKLKELANDGRMGYGEGAPLKMMKPEE